MAQFIRPRGVSMYVVVIHEMHIGTIVSWCSSDVVWDIYPKPGISNIGATFDDLLMQSNLGGMA